MIVVFPLEVQQVQGPSTKLVANGVLVMLNVLAYVLGQTTSWHLGPGQGWFSIFTYGFAHASP